jgi:hypothetical protein
LGGIQIKMRPSWEESTFGSLALIVPHDSLKQVKEP